MPTEEQLLEIHRLALIGEEPENAPGITARLGGAWLGSSRFRDVEALCLKTLELGPDASTLIYLGRARQVLGEVQESLRLHLAAQEIYKKTNDRAGQATILGANGGAIMYHKGGEIKAAMAV